MDDECLCVCPKEGTVKEQRETDKKQIKQKIIN